MPLVRAFRGISYSHERYGARTVPERVRLAGEPARRDGLLADVTDLVCPPYDVIDAREQDALLDRDPHNAIRLELNPGSDPHRDAAVTLARWRADGTLRERDDPCVYYYSHARSAQPDHLAVSGVVARVLLEPFGAEVRAHEHTMPGPKRDRLGLLHATRTQLSPILLVYFDRSQRYARVMARAWSDEWRARDRDGLLHQLAAIEPDPRLLGYLSRQRLYVADGHHRYETALAYQAEVRARPENADAPPGELGADWVMAVLVNAEEEELEIQATHRLLRDVDPRRLAALATEPEPELLAEPMPAAAVPDALAAEDGPTPTFGLVLPDGRGWLLRADEAATAQRMVRERTSTAVRRLDLAVLHAVVFGDRLGLDAGRVMAGEHLDYTRSADDALARVARGEAQAALLVRPTRLDQLAEVASAGDVMPQKSTYFHPKLLTGMVFNPLED